MRTAVAAVTLGCHMKMAVAFAVAAVALCHMRVAVALCVT